jgi:hypothetical protein
LAIRTDDGRIQMHGLKIFVFVSSGYGGIQATYFRRICVHTGLTADNAGPELLTILHHKQAVIRQAADHTVGSVNDQLPAGLLQVL